MFLYSLYLLLTVPFGPFVIILFGSQLVHVWIILVIALQVFHFSLFIAFKQLVVMVFMQFISEHIFYTLAEECGKTVILVMKYDNSYPILNHRYAVKF